MFRWLRKNMWKVFWYPIYTIETGLCEIGLLDDSNTFHLKHYYEKNERRQQKYKLASFDEIERENKQLKAKVKNLNHENARLAGSYATLKARLGDTSMLPFSLDSVSSPENFAALSTERQNRVIGWHMKYHGSHISDNIIQGMVCLLNSANKDAKEQIETLKGMVEQTIGLANNAMQSREIAVDNYTTLRQRHMATLHDNSVLRTEVEIYRDGRFGAPSA